MGIDRRGRSFFQALYDKIVREVMRGENGYGAYIDLINSELKGKMKIDTREIMFQSRYDGTVAQHPEGQSGSRVGYNPSENKG